MPCVLPICPADVIVSTPVDAVLTADPLHFRFSSKCVPSGIFVQLAAVLSPLQAFVLLSKHQCMLPSNLETMEVIAE